MSLDKKDFFGKEVTNAIREACETFKVAQELLDIEVIETGSTGIFGLIRKKAHIRVQLKPETDGKESGFGLEDIFKTGGDAGKKAAGGDSTPEPVKAPTKPTEKTDAQEIPQEKVETNVVEPAQKEAGAPKVEASRESLDIVQAELLQIVELMGFPSTVELEAKGVSVTCTLRGEFEESLIGQEGKTLDSLQYILRKVVARKVPERLRVSINVGDFREKRIEELKVRAVELAAQVKDDGKTQVIPALNPSERRVIHMILQEDKEIRSRSIGDGLFKKILIYKPGKGNRPGGRKRSQSRGRQGKSGQNQKPKNES